MNFLESNALLAIIRDDREEAERILREMAPGELQALRQACHSLSCAAGNVRREMQRGHIPNPLAS